MPIAVNHPTTQHPGRSRHADGGHHGGHIKGTHHGHGAGHGGHGARGHGGGHHIHSTRPSHGHTHTHAKRGNAQEIDPGQAVPNPQPAVPVFTVKPQGGNHGHQLPPAFYPIQGPSYYTLWQDANQQLQQHNAAAAGGILTRHGFQAGPPPTHVPATHHHRPTGGHIHGGRLAAAESTQRQKKASPRQHTARATLVNARDFLGHDSHISAERHTAPVQPHTRRLQEAPGG